MEQIKLRQPMAKSSPLAQNKTRVENHALQKMFLMTEPAFKNIKQEIDNEKYLNEMDKQLKTILFNKRIPPYKKWLIYKDLLVRHGNFKQFLKESKEYNDQESHRKFAQLEKRINELEQLREQKSKKKMDSSQSSESEKTLDQSIVPWNDIISPEYMKQTEYTYGDIDDSFSSAIAPISDHSLTDTSTEEQSSVIEAVDETGDTHYYHPIKFNFVNDNDRREKEHDDDLISEQTPRDRLDNLPLKVQPKFLVNSVIPQHKLRMKYFYTDKIGGEKVNRVDAISVNPADIKFTKNNTIKVKSTLHGWEDYPHVAEQDFHKLRFNVIDMHREINKAIEQYNQNNPAKTINVKKYTYKPYNENEQELRYKESSYVIPNAILDDVIAWIESGEFTPTEIKEKIELKKSNYIRQEQKKQSSVSYNDPLNRSSLTTPLPSTAKMLSARNSSLRVPTPRRSVVRSAIQPRAILQNSPKTPQPRRKTPKPRQKTPTSTPKGQQPSLKSSFSVVKDPYKQQDGKGIKRKWEKI